MAACQEKKRYGNRLQAEAALVMAKRDWRRDPGRAPQPPTRVYQCAVCNGWHLTHVSPRTEPLE
jgi:hypothetical protein